MNRTVSPSRNWVRSPISRAIPLPSLCWLISLDWLLHVAVVWHQLCPLSSSVLLFPLVGPRSQGQVPPTCWCPQIHMANPAHTMSSEAQFSLSSSVWYRAHLHSPHTILQKLLTTHPNSVLNLSNFAYRSAHHSVQAHPFCPWITATHTWTSPAFTVSLCVCLRLGSFLSLSWHLDVPVCATWACLNRRAQEVFLWCSR